MVYVEVFLILFIIAVQIKVSCDLYKLIERYKTIFSKRVNIVLRGDSCPVLRIDEPNVLIFRVIDPLNQYLAANYGAAVNFTIIKDVIDREVDLNDDEISQKLPVPLYLGLAATMIGIICGLISMGIGITEITESIRSLIISVAIAMFASLLGLASTTWLTSFNYKKAKTTIAKGKADLLNELQTRLLPELNRADDSELNGLKSCLNEFARQSTKMVQDLRTVGEKTALTIKHQQESVIKLESLNIKKIAAYNATVFEKIESSFDKLDQFSSYIEELNIISSNLVQFTKSIGNIEDITKSIHDNSILSKDLSLYLTDHLKKLDTISNTVENTLSTQGYSAVEIIEKFKEKINDILGSINDHAVSFDSDIKKSTQALYAQMEIVASENGKRLSEAFAQTAPDFSPLHEINHGMKDSVKALDDLQKLDVIVELIQSNKDINQGVKEGLFEKLSKILEILSAIDKLNINSTNTLYSVDIKGEANNRSIKNDQRNAPRVITRSREANTNLPINNQTESNTPGNRVVEHKEDLNSQKGNQQAQKPFVGMMKELYVSLPNNKGEFVDNISQNRNAHNLMIKVDVSGVTGSLILCDNITDYSFFFENLQNLEVCCDISSVNKKDETIKMITEGRVVKHGQNWVVERKMKISSDGKKGFFKKMFRS